ncbi:dTMP kinase [bacterium]|nr:dTMP kinase [bacterium]
MKNNTKHEIQRDTDSRGLLLVFEGLDGAGKSTQVKRLADYLESKGNKVVVTSWNSSKYIGKAIKNAKRAQLLTPNCFSALHAADFFNRLENIIIPSLNAGKIVIADRYSYTALARDEARGIDAEWVKRIFSLAIEPDLAFLCRVPVEVALKRAMKKNGNVPKFYESGMDVSGETDPTQSFREFQGRVDKAYAKLVDKGILTPIEMDRDEDQIFDSILTEVEPLLKTSSLKRETRDDKGVELFKGSCFGKNPTELNLSNGSFISKLPKHNLPGKLIVIEGAHHAGVTHQVNALYDWLQVRNVDVVKSGMGETWITTEIMDRAAQKNALSTSTNVMLTASEMAYILEIEVLPALKRGAIVLLNRYFITTLVCGLLRGMDRDWLIETLGGFGVRPDLTIYIDTPFEILLERIDFTSLLAEESIYTGLDIGFTRDVETSFDFYQRNAISAYQEIVKADGISLLKGNRDHTELYEPISKIVSEVINISSENYPINKRLKEVLELYHQHNGYFEHAQKVREFAGQIFDATVDIHRLGKTARDLLEYAALLHDVGRSVGPEHEKHSYNIIMDYEFTELTERDKRIVAIIALYHNGSAYSLDNVRQWKLCAEEQLAVRRLSAILRVADALDSSNKQVSAKLRVSREMGALVLDINSVNKAKAERKDVLSKKDLFEQQFRIDVLVDRNRMERIKTKNESNKDGLFL